MMTVVHMCVDKWRIEYLSDPHVSNDRKTSKVSTLAKAVVDFAKTLEV